MWGYIANTGLACLGYGVPSLYVRVYRYLHKQKRRACSSLIICEGISARKCGKNMELVFPHYMWGYIVIYTNKSTEPVVPSLYVRVYRPERDELTPVIGSLIICEGISYSIASFIVTNPFPHYMWGYIGYTQRNSFCFRVPSLYVRVYRLARHGIRRRLRSLIIYEYMSVYRNW